MIAKTTSSEKVGKGRKKQNFEKSLERLETIVNEMESGSLSLEEMIARFEEGQSLLKFCSKKLNEVERRIEILVKKGDEVVAEPFEEAEGEKVRGPTVGGVNQRLAPPPAGSEAGEEENREKEEELFSDF